LIGDLKRALEQAIDAGTLEARREDAYYVAHIARHGLVPDAAPERVAKLVAAGGLADDADADASAREAEGDLEGVHRGVDHDDPSPGVLACGHDPDNDPCVHRDADPDDPDLRH
jgi:hypothetical protein